MTNAVFWDVTPRGSARRLLVTANVVPSSETSVLTRASQRNIPEHDIPHSSSNIVWLQVTEDADIWENANVTSCAQFSIGAPKRTSVLSFRTPEGTPQSVAC
jgi:hypothetical protein